MHNGDAIMAYIESGSTYVALGHIEKNVAKSDCSNDGPLVWISLYCVSYIKSLIKPVFVYVFIVAPQ